MGCDGELTDQKIEEVRMLANKAIKANNKKLAEPYINRLDFMKMTLDIEPYKKSVLSELISCVRAASGQVRDKEHWIDAVNQNLFKLEQRI